MCFSSRHGTAATLTPTAVIVGYPDDETETNSQSQLMYPAVPGLGTGIAATQMRQKQQK